MMNQSSRLNAESFQESKVALLEDFHPPPENTSCRECKSRRKFQNLMIISWLVSLVLLASLGVSTIKSTSLVWKGFWRTSEFKTATREIPATTKQVRFTAALKYNESHQVYRPVTQPPYVGVPSPEIDAAWKELLGAVNVFVTPEEEEMVGENLYLDPETGLHMAQVSVFHDLHCVNMIRKSMYLDYYPEQNMPSTQAHVEHCLDVIRLSLMCNGDMTFMPIRWSENRNWIVPDFETVHTCRDYDALKKWSKDRDAADPELYPKNAERLNADRLRSKGG